MDIVIKLKDADIYKIETDSEYEREPDYYGYIINLFDNIYIYFKDRENNGYRLHLYARDVELTTFLSFFYGVDFSETSYIDFRKSLIDHLGGVNQYGVINWTEDRYSFSDNNTTWNLARENLAREAILKRK